MVSTTGAICHMSEVKNTGADIYFRETTYELFTISLHQNPTQELYPSICGDNPTSPQTHPIRLEHVFQRRYRVVLRR